MTDTNLNQHEAHTKHFERDTTVAQSGRHEAAEIGEIQHSITVTIQRLRALQSAYERPSAA